MTDDELDAGIGRMVSRYSAVNRKIACLKSRLQEASKPAYDAAIRLRCGPDFSAAALRIDLGRVDWGDLIATADTLAEQEDERARIEACLREAGLDNLIGRAAQ